MAQSKWRWIPTGICGFVALVSVMDLAHRGFLGGTPVWSEGRQVSGTLVSILLTTGFAALAYSSVTSHVAWHSAQHKTKVVIEKAKLKQSFGVGIVLIIGGLMLVAQIGVLVWLHLVDPTLLAESSGEGWDNPSKMPISFGFLAWGLLFLYRLARRQYASVHAWQKVVWWCIENGLWVGVFWFMWDIVEEHGLSTSLLTAPIVFVFGALLFGLPVVWVLHWWREYNRPAEAAYPPVERWW